jgi:hypothetical protein
MRCGPPRLASDHGLPRWRALGRGLAALVAALACAGCVKTVLSGEDPDTLRPTATGDSKRDVLVVDIPWMQAPIPRLLIDGQPIVAERVSTTNPDQRTIYMLRTRTGATAELEIQASYPSDSVAEFVYRIRRLPSGYELDLPVALGRVGRRGPIALAVNGVPFQAPPTADAAIVNLARDERTRIRCTRIPDPPPESGAAAARPAAGATPRS